MPSTNQPTPSSPTAAPTVVRFESIDSTSAHARREAASGGLCRHPTVFVSRRQISGVGRFGRRWESPPGGLWMTLAWPVQPGEIAGLLDGLGLRIGVGCREAVHRILQGADAAAEVRLKWPNDIMANGKKVLGVLTELISHEQTPWVLVGVGLNANLAVADLPPPVDSSAGTLRDIIGRDIDLETARSQLTEAIGVALSAHGLEPATLALARANLHGVGRLSSISMPDGARVQGTLIGLNDHGAAEFMIDGNRTTIPSGAIIAYDASHAT